MNDQVQSRQRRHDRSLARSSLITFAGLAVFLLLSLAVDQWMKPVFSTTGLVILGILFSLVPAALWVGFFYEQDRREPEPKGMVLQVFVLGGLLAAALGIPLVEDIFEVQNWIYDSLWVNLAGGILVIGFTQEFLKYCAVRFSVFSSAEFDEQTDGIIYATAAGLGFAVVLNIAFVVNSNGADLGMAAIRIVLTSLAQASFAGITGYFMGREKLEKLPVWWMAAGLTVAAVLNGVFFTLWGNLTRAAITNSGAVVNPWLGLALAVVLAVAVMGGLTWLIRKDQLRAAKKEVSNG